jgi:hypothetical protein
MVPDLSAEHGEHAERLFSAVSVSSAVEKGGRCALLYDSVFPMANFFLDVGDQPMTPTA